MRLWDSTAGHLRSVRTIKKAHGKNELEGIKSGHDRYVTVDKRVYKRVYKKKVDTTVT